MRTTLALCLLGLVSIGAVQACAAIEEIQAGQCGNAIIEEGEDCDMHPRDGMPCYDATAERAKACRYACSDSAECSGGYACGADQVCRAASGHFKLAFAENGSVRSVLIGDFDGDGQKDIGASETEQTQVHYLGPALRVEQTTRVAIAHDGRPGAGSLTAPEPTDASDIALLAGPDRAGIGVLRGREDRSFAATAYPVFSIPLAQSMVFAMDAEVELDGEEFLALLPHGPSTMALLVGVNGITAAGGEIFVMAEVTDPSVPSLIDPSGNLRSDRVPVGQLDDDPLTSPCEEYVLAFRGEQVVHIVTPCLGLSVNGVELSGDPQLFDPNDPQIAPQVAKLVRPIAIDLPAPIEDAHLFDLDADGDLDVLVTPSTPATRPGDEPSEPRVAWVVEGPLDFGGAGEPAPAVYADPYPLLELVPGERLLAIAHVDADEVPDFVTSRGILVSQSAYLPCPRAPSGSGSGGAGATAGASSASATASGATASGAGGADGGGATGTGGDVHHCPAFAAAVSSHFQYAAVADLDGNGKTDVALATGSDNELLVYMGQQNGPVEHVISTTGDAQHLEVGDFDGDGLADVAVAEARTSGEVVTDAVSVCFGRPLGAPEPPAGMGHLEDVVQMLTSSFRLTGDATYADAIDDLAVVAITTERQLTLSTLSGSTDRLLQSPFRLVHNDSPDGEPDTAVGYHPTSLVVGRFAPDEPGHAHLAVFAYHRDDDASVTDRRLWLLESTDDAGLSQAKAARGPEVTAAQWDDGDELLVAIDLDGDGVDEVVALAPIGADGPPSGGAVLVAKVVGDQFEHRIHSTSDWVLGRDPFAPTTPPPVVADVDADGRLDVVTLGAIGLDPEPGSPLSLIVLFNRESADVLDALDPAAALVIALPPGTRTFAALQLDGDAPLELIAFANDGAWALEALPDAQPAKILELPGGVLVAAAVDLDGDGLAELVLGRDKLEVWGSVPSNP